MITGYVHRPSVSKIFSAPRDQRYQTAKKKKKKIDQLDCAVA